MSKQFILYDGRAKTGEPDDATVMDTAETLEEAIETGSTTWQGQDAIWYEYDVESDGETLKVGIPRWDIPPCIQE